MMILKSRTAWISAASPACPMRWFKSLEAFAHARSATQRESPVSPRRQSQYFSSKCSAPSPSVGDLLLMELFGRDSGALGGTPDWSNQLLGATESYPIDSSVSQPRGWHGD